VHPPQNMRALADSIGTRWPDILIALLLSAAASVGSFKGAQRIPVPLIIFQSWGNVWFEADAPRVFANMSNRWSNHYRTKVHPLFSLATQPIVSGLRAVLKIESSTAIRIVIASVAGLWIGVLFALLRLIGCRRLDAALFSALGGTSASAAFWFVLPETYAFGSLTILLALGIVALAEHRDLSSKWYLVLNILTMSFTVTNWMVGIIATFAKFPWRRALQITVLAVWIVTLLWLMQKEIYPSAEFFVGDREEANYMFNKEAGGPLTIVNAFVFHSMVMPAIGEIGPPHRRLPILTVQRSLPGSGSPWGAAAVGLWAVLLGLGLWGFCSTRQHLAFRVVLGLTLLGQLALHLVYGAETFLYALHFGPLLVVLAALSSLTRARPLGVALAGVLMVVVAVNNGLQFGRAVNWVETRRPAVQDAQSQITARPASPELRETGHRVGP
jgi:hypothetical protein